MGGPTLRLAGRRHSPRAFTLVELLVSLAVIGAVLVAVGIVFTGTTQTATHAAALTETQNWLRQAAEELQADLAAADRTLPLVLAGRTQAAALTEAERQAGRFYRVLVGDPTKVPSNFDPAFDSLSSDNPYSDPRADVISFFTQRRKAAQAPAPEPEVYSGGGVMIDDRPYLSPRAQWGPVHIVYGHAALAYQLPASDADLRHIQHMDGNTWRPALMSPIALTEWVLARRAIIIRQHGLRDMDFAPTPVVPFPVDLPARARLDRPDSLLACVADAKYPGDVAGMNVELMRQAFGPYFGSASPPVLHGFALYRPYEFPWVALPGDAAVPGFPNRDANLVWRLLYPGNNDTQVNSRRLRRHMATVVREPPLEYAGNLSLQTLPGCVWFQVEFLMPEDPRNSPEYDTPDPAEPAIARRHDPVRWAEIEPGQTYVFVPDTEENRRLVLTTPPPPFGNNQRFARNPATGEYLFDFAKLDMGLADPGNGVSPLASNRIVRMWPYAVRITLRAIDPARRLDAPLERTIVHRFE